MKFKFHFFSSDFKHLCGTREQQRTGVCTLPCSCVHVYLQQVAGQILQSFTLMIQCGPRELHFPATATAASAWVSFNCPGGQRSQCEHLYERELLASSCLGSWFPCLSRLESQCVQCQLHPWLLLACPHLI